MYREMMIMPPKINLKGQRFGRLLVQEETKKRDCHGSVIWQCLCDCGNITEASTSLLRSGEKKSCGCLQKDKARELGKNNLKNLVNQKFGLLTVLSYEYTKKTPSGTSKIFWKCKCDCGNEVIIEGNALRTGNTKSCGCIKSFGEQKISSILLQNNIKFEREKTFPDCNYRFDFFVENKYIIEYDGKQHFQDYSWGSNKYTKESQQQRDNEKNKYCIQHNFPIIRIPYTYYNELELKDLLLETSSFILEECKSYL